MSDLGVIVTGVVIGSASGIGGTILGSWMTGRSQLAALRINIAAENDRAEDAEKRRIYARCLAAAESMILPLYLERAARYDKRPDWEAFDIALREAVNARLVAFAELELIAGSAVLDAADALGGAFDQYKVRPLNTPPSEEEEVLGEFGLFTRTLKEAMRADLDE